MGFLSKLFGIDEIRNSINEINSILKLKSGIEGNEEAVCDYLDFVSPVDNSPFLSIESMLNYDSVHDVQKKKHIGNADKVMALIQYLPIAQNIAQSKALEGAYKIVLPEGAVGKLMQYKNGMLGTPLVQPGGKIGNTHAGLIPIEKMALSPMIVFTALSAVTGQYFMAKINKSLESISEDINDIKWMMLDDKESQNIAICNFFAYVRDNQELIINNSDLRIATIMNLQSHIVELKQNQLFYEKTINRKLNALSDIIKDYKTTGRRVDEINKLENEIISLLIQQHICIELYVIGKVYEMQAAQLYEDNYCNRLIKELSNNVIRSVKFNKEIANKFIYVLEEVGNRSIINKDKVDIQKEDVFINVVKRQESFEKNIKSTIVSISDVISLNKKEQVFIVNEGELYYLDNNIA